MESVVLIGCIVVAVAIGAVGLMLQGQLKQIASRLHDVERSQSALLDETTRLRQDVKELMALRTQPQASGPWGIVKALVPSSRGKLPWLVMVAARAFTAYLDKKRQKSEHSN